jgi:GNAT superfamily N-acetyltransferase
MTAEFAVRPYAEGDRAGLLELLTQVWPHKRPIARHVDRRWWWQIEPPPILVIDDPTTRTLGGLCAYMPFTFHARGREVAAAWFVDFYVVPALQGRGFGQQLTRAVQARFPLTASLSQTAMAWRVFQKLGWRERAGVEIGMHPWPKAFMFPRQDGWQVSDSLVNSALPVREDLDALWARVGPAFSGIAARTSEHLIRRYAPHGGREYRIFRARRGADCAGYMIVRASGPGLIVDALAHPEDAGAFAALLAAASRCLIDRGVRRLYCLAPPPAWRRALERRGFLFPGTPLLGRRLRSQVKWLTCLAAGELGVPDPADWFVTLGDCDLDAAWQDSD